MLITERELPVELTVEQAVEAAYAAELAEVAAKLGRAACRAWSSATRSWPVPLRQPPRPAQASGTSTASTSTAGRARAEQAGPVPIGRARHHDRPAARRRPRARVERAGRRPAAPRPAHDQPGRPDRRGPRGDPAALREPGDSVWLGFKDPSFPLPQVIENLFPHRAQPARHPAEQAAAARHPEGGAEVRPAVQPVGALQVRLRRQRRPAAQAALDARGGGLPGRPEARLPPAAPGDAHRHRWKSRTSTSTATSAATSKVKKRLRQEILDVLARRGRGHRRRGESPGSRS